MKLKIKSIVCSTEDVEVTVTTSDDSTSSIYRFGKEALSYPKGNHSTEFLASIGAELKKTEYFKNRDLTKAKQAQKQLEKCIQ